jgi:hypothetical protein
MFDACGTFSSQMVLRRRSAHRGRMENDMQRVDILIAGGSYAGLSLAAALSKALEICG